LTSNSFAKNIPPGSGIGDVPANVLILLDKSGSMGARMTSGAGMMYPNSTAVDSNGDVYAGQYSNRGIKKFTYATKGIDSTFGSSGTYRGTGNCRSYYPYIMKVHNGYLYAASYYQHRIFRINLSTGACDWNSTRIVYPRSVAISKNNILYAGHNSGLFVRNLSTNTNISCSASGNLWYIRYAFGTAVDPSASNIYVHYNRYLYRYAIQGNHCPSTSYASRAYRSQWRYGYGMRFHPTDDSILYATSYYEHKLYKFTLSAQRNAFSSVQSVGRCCRGASSASNVRFYYPAGVAVDTTNNRVFVANYHKNAITAFDLNLGFIKEFGGSAGTRMSGAHEAIKAIVTDSSLTAGVNFGFAYWASGSSGFRSWSGNITTGRAIPCSSQNCLKVRAHKQGASRINQIITSVNPGGGTDAMAWARIGSQYYLNSMYSPVDKNLTCQNSYLLVIGDGSWGGHNNAKRIVQNLLSQHKIKTFTVAYGGGIGAWGINNFRKMAQAGGTNDVIIANTTASLKSQLKAAISQVIASKLSFTAPAITATIKQGGSLFQAQFDYEQNKEWRGTLKRTAISPSGVIDEKDKSNWSAADKLPAPNSRKIWSEIPGTDYKTDLNNFKDSNWNEINTLFQQTNNEVSGYHSVSDNPVNSRRCASASGVANGTDDDVKGLINFIRGKDYFDYDGDCNLTETRPNPLGDIYHSEMVVVAAPNADTVFVGTNQESYFRSKKGYDAWAASKSTRKEMIYVGANDGMLHAFDAKTGAEEWAFVPPFVASSIPNMVNVNLNRSIGGSNAIYGVDGSPVVHDMYFQSAYDSAKSWHTIMMIPYGRGGAGFSVLDITDPAAPRHLYSVLNDHVLHKVHVMDHKANINTYDYIASSYPLSSFEEAIIVTDNYAMSTGSMTCDATGNNQCYKSKTWTFPVRGITKSDLTVLYNGNNYTNFNVSANSSGDTQITFNTDMTYYGGDPGDDSKASSELGVLIKPGSAQTGVQTQPEYDYSALGETWSSPRIFRLPNNGAGDSNIDDDIYVAAMGGGFGAQYSGFGSNLTIVNLEDTTYPGRIQKIIPIEDLATNDIVNSTPGTPVIITPDTARGVSFKGALIYLNDLEGKITKFNLTNMSDDGKGNVIALYDNTTLFTAGSTSTNGRYMYHSMDATIGQSTNTLWLFAGTGDYERLVDTSSGNDNLMLGIADPDYPIYKEVNTPTQAYDLTKCQNTTNDSSGAKCPQLTGDKGWYIKLDNSKKVTAEPTVSSGLVYFPIYKPSSSVNKCSLGDAFICAVDDECGTNLSSKLGANSGASKNEKCKYVGRGILSKIVTFAGKLFANIAGESLDKSRQDLVTLDGATSDVTTYRSSWRNNY
jgi:type IV pilus assembly protein PilY1